MDTEKRRVRFALRFWERVIIRGEDECWDWSGPTDFDGYGVTTMESEKTRAHRAAFIVSGGQLSAVRPLVIHSCDNRACCNPRHLRAGSAKENTGDMMQRKRHGGGVRKVPPRGELNGSVKLRESQVIEIRKLIAAGVRPVRIAQLFSVSDVLIGKIKNGKLWKHVP